MEIITAIVTTLVAVIGWFIARNVNRIESDLKSVGQKVFKLQVNTQEQLAVINSKLTDVLEDLRSFSVAADKLKTEIQEIHIKNASQGSNALKIKETFGKVIVLEDRFDKLQIATKNVLSELKSKRSQG